LEEEAGQELLVRCGGVFFGPREHPSIAATQQALSANHLPFEIWDAAQMKERVPALQLRSDEIAIYQSDSGFLRANDVVQANVRLARNFGATIHEDTAISAILQHKNEVIIRTEKEEFVFDRALVTAGAWMGQLLKPLNLPLRVTRQQIVYLRPEQNFEMFEAERFPIWIDGATNYYGFPMDGRIEGVKIAWHQQGQEVRPDNLNRNVDDEYIAQLQNYAAQRLPDLSSAVTHSAVCLYTNTPNEDFLLDFVPGMQNIFFVSGCSGHGFKFTVLLGYIAAQIITGHNYERDISRFHLP
jgi:sarcosine oxidase